jgi:hypothetical protein
MADLMRSRRSGKAELDGALRPMTAAKKGEPIGAPPSPMRTRGAGGSRCGFFKACGEGSTPSGSMFALLYTRYRAPTLLPRPHIDVFRGHDRGVGYEQLGSRASGARATRQRNWTPIGPQPGDQQQRVTEKSCDLQDFLEGERGDSNPRPPGPQPGRRSGGRCRSGAYRQRATSPVGSIRHASSRAGGESGLWRSERPSESPEEPPRREMGSMPVQYREAPTARALNLGGDVVD